MHGFAHCAINSWQRFSYCRVRRVCIFLRFDVIRHFLFALFFLAFTYLQRVLQRWTTPFEKDDFGPTHDVRWPPASFDTWLDGTQPLNSLENRAEKLQQWNREISAEFEARKSGTVVALPYPSLGPVPLSPPHVLVPADMLKEIHACGDILFSLPARASADVMGFEDAMQWSRYIITKAIRSPAVDGIYIGITRTPARRWAWHSHRGFTTMEVIHIASCAEENARIEVALLNEFFSKTKVENCSRGGETALPSNPHFLYVCKRKSTALWRHDGRRGTGKRGRKPAINTFVSAVSRDLAL